MIPKTKELVLEIIENYGPFKRVLEVGSRVDAERFVISQCFDCEYVGVDMEFGTGVTHKLNGHDLLTQFAPESFDLVMSFDCLEHDDKFWLTVEQMKAVLKKGGLMAIGVPSLNCPLHRHPFDYYRFMDDSQNVMFEGFEILIRRNLEQGGELQTVGRKL